MERLTSLSNFAQENILRIKEITTTALYELFLQTTSMDTTLVSYMFRIKNIYVLLKGNETNNIT